MNAVKIVWSLSYFLASTLLIPSASAGVATSTVDQIGTKIGFNANNGSASKIGTFDFNFPNGLAGLDFIEARIRLSVQLPPEAFGVLAPQIVFAKLGQTNLDQALIAGHAIRTDVRISYNLFPSGLGVVEKQTDFVKLTSAQNLALSSILASDPSHRVDAWLVSDTLTAITVPASGEFLDLSGPFPIVVVTRYDSTLDLKFVPEPSTSIAFTGLSLWLLRGARSWTRDRNKKSSNNKG
ncbi:MAG: hypothetical protein NT168_13120 [Planctomycetota bacterium]|nr:hypothetical protein [Planctomycetota bacterium]